MKIEFLAHYRAEHGTPLGDRIVAGLPRAAHRAGPLRRLGEPAAPAFPRSPVLSSAPPASPRSARCRAGTRGRSATRARRAPPTAATNGEVVLFVDTFNRWFEADVARAAQRVLAAAGYAVSFARAARRRARPLCCGRTYLGAGLLDEARAEAKRTIDALAAVRASAACRSSASSRRACSRCATSSWRWFRPTRRARSRRTRCCSRSSSRASWTPGAGRRRCARSASARSCTDTATRRRSARCRRSCARCGAIPGLDASAIDSSCCGMAGTFGYEAEHYEISMRMAERDLLPAVRDAAAETLVVADGMSCKHQIAHGAQRRSLHVAEVYAAALTTPQEENRHDHQRDVRSQRRRARGGARRRLAARRARRTPQEPSHRRRRLEALRRGEERRQGRVVDGPLHAGRRGEDRRVVQSRSIRGSTSSCCGKPARCCSSASPKTSRRTSIKSTSSLRPTKRT